MCWNWIWMSLRSAQQGPTQDAENQTETSFSQRCDSCTIIFALSGDKSFAGHCSICNRQIFYMCNASLRFVTTQHDWNESTKEVTYTCDDCLMQENKNKWGMFLLPWRASLGDIGKQKCSFAFKWGPMMTANRCASVWAFLPICFSLVFNRTPFEELRRPHSSHVPLIHDLWLLSPQSMNSIISTHMSGTSS